MRVLVLACLALLLLPAPAAAEPELATDRPSQTVSSGTVPRGLFQIEGGASHGERKGDGESLSFSAFPEASLRIGIADGFELRIGVPGFRFERTDETTGTSEETGLVDASLGIKVEIFEGAGAIPQAAFLGTLLLPSGDDEFSSNRVDPAFRFALANTLSDRWSLSYNLGIFWLTEPAAGGVLDTRSFFDWTIAAGYSAHERVGCFVEAFGTSGISGGGKPANSIDGGVTYLVTPRLQLDGTVAAGLSSSALDWRVSIGASYRFPRFRG